jgi:hypothetical protein
MASKRARLRACNGTERCPGAATGLGGCALRRVEEVLLDAELTLLEAVEAADRDVVLRLGLGT